MFLSGKPEQARSQGGGGVRGAPPPQLPIPKILFHPLAWGPIKVTIPSSYRWKYAPLWLINHPRRLELDSLFLPWYRQPNHTLYHRRMGRGGWGGAAAPPPPQLLGNSVFWAAAVLFWGSSNGGRGGGVFQFSGGRMTSRGQCPRGGGGGGACECPRGIAAHGKPKWWNWMVLHQW